MGESCKLMEVYHFAVEIRDSKVKTATEPVPHNSNCDKNIRAAPFTFRREFMPLIDPALKEILVCPCPHHADLETDEDAQLLRCAQCKLAFSVTEGIPVMLLEEAVVTPEYNADRCGAPDAVAARPVAS